jgi:hypothetical protein
MWLLGALDDGSSHHIIQAPISENHACPATLGLKKFASPRPLLSADFKNIGVIGIEVERE